MSRTLSINFYNNRTNILFSIYYKKKKQKMVTFSFNLGAYFNRFHILKSPSLFNLIQNVIKKRHCHQKEMLLLL